MRAKWFWRCVTCNYIVWSIVRPLLIPYCAVYTVITMFLEALPEIIDCTFRYNTKQEYTMLRKGSRRNDL